MLFISLMLYMVFAMISFFVPHMYEVYLGVTIVTAIGFPMIYTLPPLLMAELCNNGKKERSILIKEMTRRKENWNEYTRVILFTQNIEPIHIRLVGLHGYLEWLQYRNPL